ncbi:MAG: hypothetical protein HQK81_05780 [Desulfovibrionaceae bacterium]|nr:hypothetical protein [Desulfovibrionaceae bacterium]MBF0513559.1 hypothetical protein [Desulfovibrionaceae bacterium]
MKTAFIVAALLCLSSTGAYAQSNECKIGDFYLGMPRADYDKLNVKLRLNDFNDPLRYACETKQKFINSREGRVSAQQAAADYDTACSRPVIEMAFSRSEVEKIYGRKLLSATAFAKEFGETAGLTMKQFYSTGGQKDFTQGYRYENAESGCRIEIQDNMTVMFRNVKMQGAP